MREWMLGLAPVGLVAYFVIYPAEFQAFINWMMQLTR